MRSLLMVLWIGLSLLVLSCELEPLNVVVEPAKAGWINVFGGRQATLFLSDSPADGCRAPAPVLVRVTSLDGFGSFEREVAPDEQDRVISPAVNWGGGLNVVSFAVSLETCMWGTRTDELLRYSYCGEPSANCVEYSLWIYDGYEFSPRGYAPYVEVRR